MVVRVDGGQWWSDLMVAGAGQRWQLAVVSPMVVRGGGDHAVVVAGDG